MLVLGIFVPGPWVDRQKTNQYRISDCAQEGKISALLESREGFDAPTEDPAQSLPCTHHHLLECRSLLLIWLTRSLCAVNLAITATLDRLDALGDVLKPDTIHWALLLKVYELIPEAIPAQWRQ